jgi:hypothetical protein
MESVLDVVGITFIINPKINPTKCIMHALVDNNVKATCPHIAPVVPDFNKQINNFQYALAALIRPYIASFPIRVKFSGQVSFSSFILLLI